MKHLITALFVCATLACGGESKGKLTELEAERLKRIIAQREALELRSQQLQRDSEAAVAEQNGIVATACKRAGIGPECSIDIDSGVISRKKESVKK